MKFEYAILRLGTLLTIHKFATKDEWKDDMKDCKRLGFEFIALKYHHGVGVWQQVEVVL